MSMNRPRSRAPWALFVATALLASACGGAEEPTGGEGTVGGETASYQGAVASTDVARGQQIFDRRCSDCHTGEDEGYAPAVAGIGWDPARMRQQIREGNGRMPGFGENKISADDLEALLAYLVSVGGVVSASAVGP